MLKRIVLLLLVVVLSGCLPESDDEWRRPGTGPILPDSVREAEIKLPSIERPKVGCSKHNLEALRKLIREKPNHPAVDLWKRNIERCD